MRGENEKQLGWLSVMNLEARVRKDHPLRRIKPWADRALGELSPVFAAMYSGFQLEKRGSELRRRAGHIENKSGRQVLFPAPEEYKARANWSIRSAGRAVSDCSG